MKNLKIGDLVRIVSEWKGHNPWMDFPDDLVKIGLVMNVVGANDDFAVVLAEDEKLILHKRRLGVLNASR